MASLVTIGGAIGIIGGPMGSGIGAGAGLATGVGIIITVELINKYRLYKMNNHSPAQDDTDAENIEEIIINDNNKRSQHKPLPLAKAKESLAELTSKLGLHMHKDPLLDGLTQEENILKPIRLGKR